MLLYITLFCSPVFLPIHFYTRIRRCSCFDEEIHLFLPFIFWLVYYCFLVLRYRFLTFRSFLLRAMPFLFHSLLRFEIGSREGYGRTLQYFFAIESRLAQLWILSSAFLNSEKFYRFLTGHCYPEIFSPSVRIY